LAKIISVYNNKGGVGKTTLTLFLSDFLSALSINQRKSRILVIDFDTQNSCANALLGLERVSELKNKGQTLPQAFLNHFQNPSAHPLSQYIETRAENKTLKTRKKKLGNVDVLISEPDAALAFEESHNLNDSLELAQWMKQEVSSHYDFVFIDLPGNLSKRNGFSLVGAFLADYFIIPTEPNRLNINTIPDTIKMLDHIQKWRGTHTYTLLGFVLNKTDKRTKQYKLHKDSLTQFANMKGCKIYKNILPPTPKLSNATDDSLTYFTLSDRYDTYYTHVKNIVFEIIHDLGWSVHSKKPTTKH